MEPTPKAPELVDLVGRLRADLGPGFLVEVPHWDDDLAAVGLGRPDDPRFLVYLAIRPGTTRVYVECEEPAEDGDGVYRVTSSGTYDSYMQVRRIVQQHLTP